MSRTHQMGWREMGAGRRAFVVTLSAVQWSLAVSAWIDLARRPNSGVRGHKSWWATIIGINFVGPLAYFRWGRVPLSYRVVVGIDEKSIKTSVSATPESTDPFESDSAQAATETLRGHTKDPLEPGGPS